MASSLRILAAALVAAGLPLLAGSARADDQGGFHAGDIMVRLRGLVVAPENNSSSVSTIGGSVSASTTAIPELDLSYFFADKFAVEVIAGTSQHNITANGTKLGDVNAGNVWVLPPTVTVQYHPWPNATFSPYFGVGFNYTFFYSASPPGNPISKVSYENNPGAAVQVGMDYHLNGNWYANVDVKQLFVSTTAKINGGALKANVALDPLLVGVGVGYKF
jgi:outer membrane protein